MDVIRPGYLRISEVLSRLRDRTNINPLVLKDKQDIGTEVHNNIHMDALGVPPEFRMFAVRNPMTGYVNRKEERGEAYFNSYMHWKKENNPRYDIMEQRLYCDDIMITGQIDALMVKGTRLCLIDFKCSHTADKEIWEMQGHFYLYLLNKNGIETDINFYFLKLDKKGEKPTVYNFTYTDEVLSRCIEEAQKTWEEKRNAICVA
jgi:hypothetical protein